MAVAPVNHITEAAQAAVNSICVPSGFREVRRVRRTRNGER